MLKGFAARPELYPRHIQLPSWTALRDSVSASGLSLGALTRNRG